MKELYVAVSIAMLLVPGCASVALSEKDTTIVMAKKVVKFEGATEISDTFTYEGQIYAHLTFRWQPVQQEGGEQSIEVRWFNGEREISRRTHNAIFGRPPYYVWFASSGTALGAGKCRVDAYANGKHVGSKSFVVTEK